MNTQRETSGHIATIVTILIWGTTFISTKVLLADFSPMEILFYRFLMGFIALILVRPNMIPFRNWRQELLSGWFIWRNLILSIRKYSSHLYIRIQCRHDRVHYTDDHCGFGHFLLEGEKLRLTFLSGFVSALIGLLLITFNGNVVLRLNPLGDIMAAGAALVFGGYSIFMKKLNAYEYHIIELTQRVFLYGLLFMVPALFLFDFHFGLSRFSSASNILNMLFLGIGASALCFATWNYSVGVLKAVKSSAYIYMVPVITIAASVLILHENMTWIALLGGALTLLGLYISEMKPKAKLMENGCKMDA